MDNRSVPIYLSTDSFQNQKIFKNSSHRLVRRPCEYSSAVVRSQAAKQTASCTEIQRAPRAQGHPPAATGQTAPCPPRILSLARADAEQRESAEEERREAVASTTRSAIRCSPERAGRDISRVRRSRNQTGRRLTLPHATTSQVIGYAAKATLSSARIQEEGFYRRTFPLSARRSTERGRGRHRGN